MAARTLLTAVLGWLLVAAPGFISLGAQPAFESKTLTNGITLAVVYFPNSTNVSLFTFLPLGLAMDGPHQAQWSHLVEHLVVRSTFPDELTVANAETQPDNMRLDFYGNTNNWREGLSHHRRWLEGVPFTEASLAAEKPRVISECDFTAKNFYTHKFALAAWAQALRHHQSRVELKGDVLRAALPDIQRYRNEHLIQAGRATVCLVGGIEPKAFFGEAEKQFSNLKLQSAPLAKVQPVSNDGTNLNVAWDLNARHLILSWPISDPGQDGYAALLVASRQLMMEFYSSADLQSQTGQTVAGVDLTTPEGTFFYVSASLRPTANFAEVEAKLRTKVSQLATNSSESPMTVMMAQQVALSMTQVSDPAPLLAQIPAGMTPAMLEANIGLQFCANAYRYGTNREAVANLLTALSPVQIRQAVGRYLTDSKCTVCRITGADGP